VRVVILLPYRGDRGNHRDRIFSVVRPHVQELAARLGATVHEADSGHQPFSVGNSFNAAAEQAGAWDVALLHEADFIVAGAAPETAVQLVREGHPGMVYGWTRHIRLTQGGTEKLLGGRRERFQHRRDFTVGSSDSPGGPRVVSRALWDAVGGFHPGFVGWGYEDNHFRWATERVAGPSRRVTGDLLNAWHPRRQHTPDDPYFAAQASNWDLWQRLQHETG
jgi:hypothetical protein